MYVWHVSVEIPCPAQAGKQGHRCDTARAAARAAAVVLEGPVGSAVFFIGPYLVRGGGGGLVAFVRATDSLSCLDVGFFWHCRLIGSISRRVEPYQLLNSHLLAEFGLGIRMALLCRSNAGWVPSELAYSRALVL